MLKPFLHSTQAYGFLSRPELEEDDTGDGRLVGLDWGGDTGPVENRSGLIRIPLKLGTMTGGRETMLVLLFIRISLSTDGGGAAAGGGSGVRLTDVLTWCAPVLFMVLVVNVENTKKRGIKILMPRFFHPTLA